MLWHLIAIVLLLACSAFFSGSETALFSLTPGKREELKTSHPHASRRVDSLLSDPGRLLGTLLLGNLIANTAASGVFTLALLSLARRSGTSEALLLGAGGIVMTVVLLIFCEVTPKVLASRKPGHFAPLAAGPVRLARVVLLPLTTLLTRVSRRLTPKQHEPATLSDDELHTMIEVAKQRGVIFGSEEEILANLVGLETNRVRSNDPTDGHCRGA